MPVVEIPPMHAGYIARAQVHSSQSQQVWAATLNGTIHEWHADTYISWNYTHFFLFFLTIKVISFKSFWSSRGSTKAINHRAKLVILTLVVSPISFNINYHVWSTTQSGLAMQSAGATCMWDMYTRPPHWPAKTINTISNTLFALVFWNCYSIFTDSST